MRMRMNQDLQTHWAMSPVYYIVRVFGLAPYSIVFDEYKTHWKVTRLSVLYSMIAAFFILVITAPVFICQNKFLEYIHADSIAKNTDILRRVSGIIVSFICILLSLINRHKTCKLMEDMNDFDREICCTGINFNYKGMYRNNAICAIIIYLMTIPVTTLDLVVYQMIGHLHMYYVYWVLCVVIFLVNFSMVIQFVSFAHMISTRFVALNKFTAELFESSFEKKPVKINAWITKQSHKMITGNSTPRKITISKQDYVNMVCSMHYRLCDMGKELNAIYSKQILLTMGTTFIDVLLRLYRVYLILTSNEYFELTFSLVWNRIIWGVMFSQMIILITFFCSKTKQEANKITVLIHPNNFEDDEETRASVEMFYLQMLHQKFEFSGGGFFPVDSSVLYMVVGTITTYLVILIQFQMAASQGH